MKSPFVTRALYDAKCEELRTSQARSDNWEGRWLELAEKALGIAYDHGVLPRKGPTKHEAPPAQVPRDDVPGEIWDAIEEMAPRPSDPLRARLMDYALENRKRWGTETEDVATEIRRGNSSSEWDDLDADET